MRACAYGTPIGYIALDIAAWARCTVDVVVEDESVADSIPVGSG